MEYLIVSNKEEFFATCTEISTFETEKITKHGFERTQ